MGNESPSCHSWKWHFILTNKHCLSMAQCINASPHYRKYRKWICISYPLDHLSITMKHNASSKTEFINWDFWRWKACLSTGTKTIINYLLEPSLYTLVWYFPLFFTRLLLLQLRALAISNAWHINEVNFLLTCYNFKQAITEKLMNYVRPALKWFQCELHRWIKMVVQPSFSHKIWNWIFPNRSHMNPFDVIITQSEI